MNWSRLKSFRCPKCGTDLDNTGRYYSCTKTGCIFVINKQRFEEIVTQKPRERSTAEMTNDERLSELNNYGRKPMSEDFSDAY